MNIKFAKKCKNGITKMMKERKGKENMLQLRDEGEWKIRVNFYS